MERKLKKKKNSLGFQQTTLKCVHFGVSTAQMDASWDGLKMHTSQTYLGSF